MRPNLRRIPAEIRKTLRHPGRLRHLANPTKRAALGQALEAQAEWRQEGPFRVRAYRTYADYVRHQSAKVALKADLRDYDARFRAALKGRLERDESVRRGMSVLCLAARIGTEVKAFKDVGCFAVGVDLNPLEGEEHVLRGDFHELQFPDGSVDVVYTNSLDHSLDLARVLGEARRVLKPRGLLLVEAMHGRREGKDAGFYESFHWEGIDELAGLISRHGFRAMGREAITEPWPGEQLRYAPARGRRR